MNGLRAWTVAGLLLGALSLLVIPSVSFAQGIDARWLVGKWEGTSLGTTGQADRREILFKEDGTWTGDNQSARIGLITSAGKYTIEAQSVSLEGRIINSGTSGAPGQSFNYSLVRKGETLDGTAKNLGTNREFPVTFTRVK